MALHPVCKLCVGTLMVYRPSLQAEVASGRVCQHRENNRQTIHQGEI